MLFNSLTFWAFFPLFLLCYFLSRGRGRLLVCLLGSYIFYAWWEWRCLFLILLITLINYGCGLGLVRFQRRRQRRWLLVAAITSNLGVLGFFKYMSFFVSSLAAGITATGLDWNTESLTIILPVGISFYTFQAMSYAIDVYREQMPCERSLLRFSTYVAFFPQLVAGPIVRANHFLPQLSKDRPFRWDDIAMGTYQIAWGFVLKCVVADSLALLCDFRFASPLGHSPLSLAVGVFLYAFQIYGDFAGYSLMAIGFARIMGFVLPKNFSKPYFSPSFSAFWRRWHISLSSWLRDYVYIPLGGNRVSRLGTFRNLMVTMFLGGLWHGAGWTFIVWGLIHGVLLVLERGVASVLATPAAKPCRTVLKPLARPLVFATVALAFVVFRAQSLQDAWFILQRVVSVQDYAWASVSQKFHVVKGIGLVAMLVLVECLGVRIDFVAMARRRPVCGAAFVVVCLLLLSLFGTFGEHAFIYFQF